MLPRVILVRPRGGANVGSVCRAMMNMGATDLRIVGGDFDITEAQRMAVHARAVLDGRRTCQTLSEAVAGTSLVVGTTARKGPYRDRSVDIREITPELLTQDDALRPAAVVFGPEDTGLTNEDIAGCHRLAFIPTADAYPSLNLAQAVMVVMYELHRARLAATGVAPSAEPSRSEQLPGADAGDVEAMFVGLEKALIDVGFLPSDNPDHIMASLRAMVGRAGLDDRELRILRGIVRQLDWYVTGGREVALAKIARGEKIK